MTSPPAREAQRNAIRLRDSLVVALALTTGAVDAVTFLLLGKVFASVMTGNMVLLGLAAGQRDGSLAINGSLTLAAYSLGVVSGGALARPARDGQPAWPRRVTVTLAVELVLLAGFSGGWLATAEHPSGASRLVLLALVCAAMGMQATAVRRLGPMSSTYLTSTLTGVLEGLALRRRPADWPRSAGILLALVIGAALGSLGALRAPAVVPVAVMVPLAVVLASRLLSALVAARSR
jgi:uncharacterized membrane protein YoaK (UPF0700 family)